MMMIMKMTSLRRKKLKLLQRKRTQVQAHLHLTNNQQINLRWLNLQNKTLNLKSKIRKNQINLKICKRSMKKRV